MRSWSYSGLLTWSPTGGHCDRQNSMVTPPLNGSFSLSVRCYCYCGCSATSSSLWPHGLWRIRLLRPRDSLGKNTGVGCQALLLSMGGNYKYDGLSSFLWVEFMWLVLQISRKGGSPWWAYRVRWAPKRNGFSLVGRFSMVEGWGGTWKSHSWTTVSKERGPQL